MKRNASLVSYDSSDEDATKDNPEPRNNLSSGPKRYAYAYNYWLLVLNSQSSSRKLPKLSPSIVVSSPKSDPSQHQGRIRSSPHVEGQFAAYVYIPVPLDNNEKLKNHLSAAIHRAKEIVPELMCDWVDFNSNQTCSSEKKGQGEELHISLTRPIYLRHYQREDLKRAVKQIARNHTSCVVHPLLFQSRQLLKSFVKVLGIVLCICYIW